MCHRLFDLFVSALNNISGGRCLVVTPLNIPIPRTSLVCCCFAAPQDDAVSRSGDRPSSPQHLQTNLVIQRFVEKIMFGNKYHIHTNACVFQQCTDIGHSYLYFIRKQKLHSDKMYSPSNFYRSIGPPYSRSLRSYTLN